MGNVQSAKKRGRAAGAGAAGGARSRSRSRSRSRTPNRGSPSPPAAARGRWAWDFKDGRAVPRYTAPAGGAGAAEPPRPLFRRLPSDNYDLWIFNPDRPRRTDSGRSLG